MIRMTRRSTLGWGAAAAGTLILPRLAVAQADNRPAITVAVQKVSNSNTLDVLRDIAKTGVDFISVGALTHSAPSLDIGLDFETL